MGSPTIVWLLCSSLIMMLPRSGLAQSPIVVEWDSCELDRNITRTGYIGWPIQISCYSLGIFDAITGPSTGKEAQCQVVDYDTRETLWNKSFMIDEAALTETAYTFDVEKDSPKRYVVMYHVQGTCRFEIVDLKITELKSPECENLAESSKIQFSKGLGVETTLKCVSKDKKLDFIEDLNVTRVWTRNCSSKLPENAVQIGDSLKFFQTRFEDAGFYQCEALYNGQSFYVVEHQLCVRFKSTQDHSVTMECPDVVEARPGRDINITCSTDLGVGKANGLYLSSEWRKVQGNMTCESLTAESVNIATDPRAQCYMHSFLKKKCYFYDPHIDSPEDIVEVILTIRNVKESDTGYYNVSFVSSNLKIFGLVRVELNRDDELKIRTVAMVSTLCSCILLFLLFILGFWKRYDVRWLWKKKFGSYDLDSFMAYLAYYYDNNNKSSEVDPSTLVTLLETFIKKIGGETFNPERDEAPGQYDIDNMCSVMKDCQHVIVILTPEYVKDDLSILKVYKGFEKEIKEERKIIFIHLPGADRAIENLIDVQKRALKKAIKMNRSLSWSGQNPLDGKFKRRLEYYLPKLPSRSYDRSHSTSSQAKLTRPRGQLYSIPSSSNDCEGVRFDSV